MRSAYSTLYGSDAVGGVINILTSDPAFSEKPGFHGSFTGKWMSRDMEQTASVTLGYKSKNISGEVIDWEKFKNQNIVKPIAPIEVKIEIPSTQESYDIPELKPVKKKAFFG